MAIHKLEYAQKHLAELFEEALDGEDVMIVREDGRACELIAMTETFSFDTPLSKVSLLPDETLGELTPA